MSLRIHTLSNADVLLPFRNWNPIPDNERNPDKQENPAQSSKEKAGIPLKKERDTQSEILLANQGRLSKKKRKALINFFVLGIPVSAITALIVIQGFFIVSNKELHLSSDATEVYPVFAFFMITIITALIYQKKT